MHPERDQSTPTREDLRSMLAFCTEALEALNAQIADHLPVNKTAARTAKKRAKEARELLNRCRD